MVGMDGGRVELHDCHAAANNGTGLHVRGFGSRVRAEGCVVGNNSKQGRSTLSPLPSVALLGVRARR